MACGEPRRRMGNSLRFLVTCNAWLLLRFGEALFLVLTIKFQVYEKVFKYYACSKDDDEKEKVQDTTYTFSYTANDPPKGFTTNITLFEYNEKGEQIVQNHVNNCKKGRSEKFTANTDSRKIKVYLVVTNGTQSVYNWVQQVYYLEKEKNIDVSVTGESRVGTKEP